MNTSYNVDLSRVPNELVLQSKLLQKEPSFKYHLSQNLDSKRFIQLALHHRIYPYLYRQLMHKNVELPSDILITLEKYSQDNLFRMLQLSGEMLTVSKLFFDNKLPVLFLKGPILGLDLYGDISLRTSGDLDILVPIHRLQDVHLILIKNGYVKEEDFPTVLGEWKWRRHHTSYTHSERNIKVEIHWRMHPGPGKEPAFRELWKRKRKREMSMVPIYYLSSEDLFMFLACHGARHGWSRLRWLHDIDVMSRQSIDWLHLRNMSSRYGCQHIIGQAFVLARILLQTEIPIEFKKISEQSHIQTLAQNAVYYLETMVNLHSDPILSEVSLYHERYLLTLKTPAQKFLFYTSFLYPYPKDTDVLPLPKPLHFLYFPLRPFLWYWDKNKKVHNEEGIRR